MDTEITFRSEQRLTQAEFFDWVQRRPLRDTNRYELIHGRIVMSPGAGLGHARRGAWLCRKLSEYVDERQLGVVLDSSAGYDLPSGDMLEPDVSFISKERLAAVPTLDEDRFIIVVPDLAIEILSPSTARRDRGEKKEIYAACGVREYWLVDAKRREVLVFNLRDGSYGAPITTRSGVVGSEILPDLAVEIEHLFK